MFSNPLSRYIEIPVDAGDCKIIFSNLSIRILFTSFSPALKPNHLTFIRAP